MTERVWRVRLQNRHHYTVLPIYSCTSVCKLSPLPISDENVVQQPGPHLLSSASQNSPTPSVFKPRKPFACLSSSAKRKRMASLFTREPEFDEISAVRTLYPKKAPADQRKADNEAVSVQINSLFIFQLFLLFSTGEKLHNCFLS